MSQSISQIVRGIIDDLSDGVSELVLIVVVMAEQNAAVPDQLPPAASTVNQTANTLAQIARELARTDYVDFTEIVREINESADAVDGGTSTMARAIQTLQGPGDRKSGWNGLVDACRVMSGKTIRLLQIVYGADLKRLQMTADQLMDSIGGVVSPTRHISRPDKQKFVDDVGGVTTKALKLADFVAAKANDTDSPYSRDLLKKIARDLQNSAQEVVDLGNKSLQDPVTWGPKFDRKLSELRGQIAQAKQAVEDSEVTAPIEKLTKLLPLIEAAMAEAETVPKALSQGPEKYPNQERACKEAVQEVVRKIKPNPKRKRDADRIEQSLADQVLAARNALRSGRPGDKDKLEDATKSLLDALAALRKRGDPDKTLTPEQLNEFQNALANLRKTGNNLLSDPRDKEQQKYEEVKGNLAGLKGSVKDNNADVVPSQLRGLVGNVRDLSDQMKKNAANPATAMTPWQRERKNQAAGDLDRVTPGLVNATKNALPLNNPGKNNDLLGAIRKVQRAADRGGKPNDEKEMRDVWADILKAMQRARDGAKRGDQDEVDDALKALQDALKNLRHAADRRAGQLPDRSQIDKPSEELQRLFDKFAQNARDGARGNQGANRDNDNVQVPAINDAWRRLDNAANASTIAPIQEIENLIDDVQAAVDVGDSTRLAPAAKELLEKINQLPGHIQNLQDPRAREQAQKHLGQLQPLVRDLIQKARDSIVNPDDPKLVDDSAAAGDKLKVPLAHIKHAIDPNSYDRPVEGAGAETKRALAELRDALKSGDPERIRNALQNLKNAMDRYNGVASQAADNIGKTDPKKQNVLNAALGNFRDTRADVNALQNKPTETDRIYEVMDSVGDALDDVSDAQKNNTKDDIIRATALANNLIAGLSALGNDDMDLGDLLGAAGQLSDLLRGLIGDTTGIARKLGTTESNLSPAAQAALELDQLLARLEGREIAQDPEPLQFNIQSLPAVALNPAVADNMFTPLDLKTAVSFEDVAAAVAYDLHQKAKAVSAVGDAIAMELQNLSAAARSGDRTKLLMAAKAVAAHIQAYCRQLTELAHAIPCRNERERREQDRLLKCASGLKDYATQLKILAAVKAATIEDSRDTDATLSVLTRNLGGLLSQGLTAMAVTQATIINRK